MGVQNNHGSQKEKPKIKSYTRKCHEGQEGMLAFQKSSTNFLLNGDIGEMTLQAEGTEARV